MQQALSVPFPVNLTAAPAKGLLAWTADSHGSRNLWVAEPNEKGSGYSVRQLTHYNKDDGQELSELRWTPDAGRIVYVRGGGAQGPTHPAPNPAWLPLGARQQIWEIGIEGGEPRLLGDGNSVAMAPNGKTLAFVASGQIWTLSLDTPNAKAELIMQMRTGTRTLRWSPDGSRLGFVSERGDHSFIGVYSVADKSLTYLDPSTDLDSDFTWSPDSTRVAVLRIPSVPAPFDYGIHRSGPPWSIRMVDVATGQGHQVWRAAEGMGSVYQPVVAEAQLQWVVGGKLVFAWERDGWQHFYSVPIAGGKASLLTPGDFEVAQASMSGDRKLLVFGSNQGDLDREHVWKVSFADDGSNSHPEALTSGKGIETYPVVASDNTTVAVLRSDAHLPLRAAIIKPARLVDIAPQAIPADFPGSRFVEPKPVILTASDGLQTHGQLFLPPEMKPGERHPAIVYFHGGSRRQMLLGWHYGEYYSGVYAMNQYLVSKGYIVLSVNYRSGTGYGLNFREAPNYGPAGASEYKDALAAGLYLKNRSDVAGKRIACWGGSWGGYLTALALARNSDVFAAGVDLHGVYDWGSLLPQLNPETASAEHMKKAQIAFASSPVGSIAAWRSPVLMIHGDDDRNAPFAETVEQAAALRKHGVDYEELILPDEIHGFLLERTWLRVFAAMDDFLDKKLIKKP